MKSFPRIDKLPAYVFSTVDQLKLGYLQQGIALYDFSMGNPDGATPEPIVKALKHAADNPSSHRYIKPPIGLDRLRSTISGWYQSRYDVEVNADKEVIVTLGAKEGISHLALAMCEQGDVVLVPTPSYPIHSYAFMIANATVDFYTVQSPERMLDEITEKIQQHKKIRAIMLNFPANPTGQCVELGFFEEIIGLAQKHAFWVIHDFAYADLCFDGYHAPSILQAKHASDYALEICSLSKSYNMPGWRIGYAAGNQHLIRALTKIKSYYDYGLFAPIQTAAIEAIANGDLHKQVISDLYERRRNILCDGLNAIGWQVNKPKATMFVWATIPEQFNHLDSLSFTKCLLDECRVVVAPGIGFGEKGDNAVRFALIENEQRMSEALKNIHRLLQNHHKYSAKERRFGTR